MKLMVWGLALLVLFILGVLVNIGGGIYMFLWAAVVLMAIGTMKLAHPAR
jgi:cell division protein FtsL